jgi:general secretion pathway protein A
MYTTHFGLKTDPFLPTADPAFLYMSNEHREALDALISAIHTRKGLVVLEAEAGMGKTTLLGTVIQRLQDQIRHSLIVNPALTPAEVLKIALLDFGVTDIPADKALRLDLFQQVLIQTQREGKIAVLLIDEAHKLSSEVLEEISQLSNLELARQKLLQVVLSGQMELTATLDKPELWQLNQHVAFRIAISPLNASDVEQYIQHRWQKAGGGLPTPFEVGAIERIAASSRGIPRVINVICDNALTLGFADNAYVISRDHIVQACAELRGNEAVQGRRDIVDRVFDEPKEVDRGLVPSLRARFQGARIVDLRIPRSMPVLPFDGVQEVACEEYRKIRTRILHHASRPRVFLVSSPCAGDGKTITAMNLGGALALKDSADVLVVDADFSRGTLQAVTGIPGSPGLREVLTGKVPLEDAIVQASQFRRLYLLSAGQSTVNPAELLDSEAWLGFMEKVRKCFGYVVLDAPPVEAVPFYARLLAACDGMLLVARPDHTGREELNDALGNVPKSKFLGLVLNCNPRWFLYRRDHGRYGYYSHV